MLNRTKNRFYAAAVLASSPENYQHVLADRREQAANQRLKTRAIGVATDMVVALSPERALRTIDAPYVKAGYRVVGHGLVSVVLQDPCQPDSVLKLNVAATRKSRDTQNVTAVALTEQQQTTIKHLGDFVLPQDFAVQQHPLAKRPSHTALVARQPYVDLKPVRLHTDADLVDMTVDQREQLAEFAQRAAQLQEEAGLVPDLSGLDNVGFCDGRLLLVDTVCHPLDKIPANALAVRLHTLQLMAQAA